jgi:predicted hotdog family 3-hydroxylacyl-ACP dehydratase
VELVTIELKINFLLPIAKGRVEAEATVLRGGRNFVVVECDVRNDSRELAAKSLMTFGAAGLRAMESGRDTFREGESVPPAKTKRPGKRVR